MITVEVRGLDEAARAFSVDVDDAVRVSVERSLLRMQRALQVYPSPPAPGEWAANTTPGQRRAFFAKLRAGQAGRRSGALARGWVVRVSGSGEITGTLENRVEYAQFVQGDSMQARFHRGRWQTDRAVVEDEVSTLVDDLNDELARRLR